MKVLAFGFTLGLLVIQGSAQSLDWCTYWQWLGLSQAHPECIKTFQDSQCAGRQNEEFGCTNCQPNCGNPILYSMCAMPCDPGCSCKSGFVRNPQNLCVPPSLCPSNDQMMPARCPTSASIGLVCNLKRTNACTKNNDCVTKDGFPQPVCCVTDCGNNICFQTSSG